MGPTYTWVGETRHMLNLEEEKGELLGKRRKIEKVLFTNYLVTLSLYHIV